MNKAYKRVKANKGASSVDGMSIEEALVWLKENGNELLMNMLRKDIKDKMLIELIKRYRGYYDISGAYKSLHSI